MGAEQSTNISAADERTTVIKKMRRAYGNENKTTDEKFKQGMKGLKKMLSQITENNVPISRVFYLQQMLRAFIKQDNQINMERLEMGILQHGSLIPHVRAHIFFIALCGANAKEEIKYTAGLGVGNAKFKKKWKNIVNAMVVGVPAYLLQAAVNKNGLLSSCNDMHKKLAGVEDTLTSIAIKTINEYITKLKGIAAKIKKKEFHKKMTSSAMKQKVKLSVHLESMEEQKAMYESKFSKFNGAFSSEHQKLAQATEEAVQALRKQKAAVIEVEQKHNEGRIDAEKNISSELSRDIVAATKKPNKAENVCLTGSVSEIFKNIFMNQRLKMSSHIALFHLAINKSFTREEVEKEMMKYSEADLARIRDNLVVKLLKTHQNKNAEPLFRSE